jgi:LmbE family N-acetylglucosaminyl deacetylase
VPEARTDPSVLDLTGQLRLLCVGAHADDIEIGAGGTILRLIAEGRVASAHWLVLAGHGERAAEARAGAAAFLDGVADRTVEIGEARDGYFPAEWAAIKDQFEALKAGVQPDLILTHRRDDLHQDHRIVAELTLNTFRHHLILEYEIPKYDADLGAPNMLVALTPELVDRKIELLTATYRSQAQRTWFTPDTFRGLARLRGIEAAALGGFAEGFFGRKVVL